MFVVCSNEEVVHKLIMLYNAYDACLLKGITDGWKGGQMDNTNPIVALQLKIYLKYFKFCPE